MLKLTVTFVCVFIASIAILIQQLQNKTENNEQEYFRLTGIVLATAMATLSVSYLFDTVPNLFE